MRHLRTGAAGAIAAAILIGCGPGKELPDERARTTGTERGPADHKEMVPTQSDPAAVAIVERAIKSHTQNNPALLEKGKISRVTAKGTIKLGGERPTSSSRMLVAHWPDQIKMTYDSAPPAAGSLTFIMRGETTWWGQNGKQGATLNPQTVVENMRTAGLGEHWLVLLFPLVERNSVVYGLRKGAGVGTPPADVLRLSRPDRPIYRLEFAPGTGLLQQIDYEYTDVIGPALHEWMLSDYKNYSGLLLPSQLKMARTTEHPKFRDVVEEWTVEKWEFPDKLDEGAFDPPK